MGNKTGYRKFQVCLLGSSRADPVLGEQAYAIGRFIGEKGWILLNGGRIGVMEYSSKGCAEAGGISVGILPYDEIDRANPYTAVSIPTGIGWARNSITAIAGDVIILLGGESGTLCELTYAWQAKKKILACSWVEGVSKQFAGKKLDSKHTGDPEYRIIDCPSFDILKQNLINLHNEYLKKKSGTM